MSFRILRVGKWGMWMYLFVKQQFKNRQNPMILRGTLTIDRKTFVKLTIEDGD